MKRFLYALRLKLPVAALFLTLVSCNSGLNPGDENYQIPDFLLPEPPAFSHEGGKYDHDIRVTLTTDLAGGSIRYTDDGTAPALTSPKYTGPVLVAGHGITKTIKAATVSRAGKLSAVSEKTYRIAYLTDVEPPAFDPPPGVFSVDTLVSITVQTPGSVIRYTADGSDPGPDSPPFSDPILVSDNKTTVVVRARGYRDGLTPSPVVEAVYSVWYDPAVPSNLRYARQNASTILLEWDGSAPGYQVMMSAAPSMDGQFVSPDRRPYLDRSDIVVSDLVPGTAYYFRVRSADSFGEEEKLSPWSPEIEITLPVPEPEPDPVPGPVPDPASDPVPDPDPIPDPVPDPVPDPIP